MGVRYSELFPEQDPNKRKPLFNGIPVEDDPPEDRSAFLNLLYGLKGEGAELYFPEATTEIDDNDEFEKDLKKWDLAAKIVKAMKGVIDDDN